MILLPLFDGASWPHQITLQRLARLEDAMLENLKIIWTIEAFIGTAAHATDKQAFQVALRRIQAIRFDVTQRRQRTERAFLASFTFLLKRCIVTYHDLYHICQDLRPTS